MKTKLLVAALCLATALLACPLHSAAKDALQVIQLPAPQTDGGKPLMQVLKNRQSGREYADKAMPDQTLANLLWAADGVNRADIGKRTAPSAKNWQEIEVYVALPDGMYVYDAKANQLKLVLAGDLRGATGKQPFVKDASVNLVYIADLAKTDGGDEDKLRYTSADAAFIAENVYLFCASEGLVTVVRGNVDRDALAKTLKLKPTQRIVLAQTVGYPKK